MKKLVVITGAGMSAESGISTFRDSDGLWENHRVADVADIDGWTRNPKLVLDFYNTLRRDLQHKQPNAGHTGLAALEKHFDVQIVTQNIDNLHERAGSSHVLHLHGELTKACDERKSVVKDIGYSDIRLGDQLGDTQMRPFIVWFNEAVPAFDQAVETVRQADIVAVIGTSLKVYPAAGLLNYAPENAPVYLIDPRPATTFRPVHIIQKTATEGVAELSDLLLKLLTK